MRLAFLVLLTASLLSGQTPTFSSNTELVIRTVSAKDKAGEPLKGLTAKNFILTEDGKPQTISICEFQRLTDQSPSAQGAAPQAAPLFDPTAPPDPTRFRDHRLLAIYFDLSAMPPVDQIRAFAAARQFTEKQMTALDLVEILTFSGGAVRVEQDFTGDRSILQRTLRDLLAGQSQGITGKSNDAAAIDAGTAFGQDDGEFNIFNTDRQLAALQTAANMLGQIREKKVLVYFASGLRLNGLDNQAQLQSTINAAIRAGVSFWPIDARGLIAQAPLGDATVGSNGSVAMYSGTAAQAVIGNFDRSQDTLWTLASDTGGKALLNFNDLSRGIVQARESISSYYILGYYTSNRTLDGHFRRVKITLASPLSASLDYSAGYYAAKEFGKFNATERERQLEDALMLPNPITELTIALEIGCFQLNRAEYFVPLTVKIPGGELALPRRRGAEHTLIDFIGEIKDEFGSTITNFRDKVDVKLTGETAAQISQHPLNYQAGFTLLPGHYVLKFLARDDETGRIGTFQTRFIVPNLEKETRALPISSVVLSSQIVPNGAALFYSKKGFGDSDNPLADAKGKLIPSVTRVFHKDRPVHVYMQAYEHDVENVQTLVALVTIFGDQTADRVKVFETPAMPVSVMLATRSHPIPIRFDLLLANLPEGRYTLQVTVLNPTTRKAAFSNAEVLLIP